MLYEVHFTIQIAKTSFFFVWCGHVEYVLLCTVCICAVREESGQLNCKVASNCCRLQAHDAQRKLSVAMWLCISSTYDQHLQMVSQANIISRSIFIFNVCLIISEIIISQLKCWRCFSLHLGSHSRK
eukprot:TRINITY_DN2022_c0_g1_i11.p1 TRINITY_DN2022_c0_g1~~TRINITY_DN2022_c0_g1_i11.p1  ORF type:complete len:127 (-),score=2.69 TRINITY_DN2022_c0_g1_i11:1065-1445(-)